MQSEKVKAVIRSMPPLPHSVPDQPFDIMQSEVCDWLCDQPEVRQWLFNHAIRGLIRYNQATGTWSGVDA